MPHRTRGEPSATHEHPEQQPQQRQSGRAAGDGQHAAPAPQPRLEGVVAANRRRRRSGARIGAPSCREGQAGGRPNNRRSSSLARSSTCRRCGLRFLPPRLISKLSMDMAERNGGDLRRRLASADFFKDRATALALRCLKTPGSRSIASLLRITAADQRFFAGGRRGAPAFAEVARRGASRLLGLIDFRAVIATSRRHAHGRSCPFARCPSVAVRMVMTPGIRLREAAASWLAPLVRRCSSRRYFALSDHATAGAAGRPAGYICAAASGAADPPFDLAVGLA